jgi:uncharacterized MAPEG superfamily protein
MTALFWVPYIINRLWEHGAWPALWNPQPDLRPRAPWAERMMRAHSNAVENLVVFAPLALAVHITGLGSSTTAAACAIYFAARAAHFLLYTLGVPLLRTVVFAIGSAAQFVLGLTLLGAI